MVVANVEPLPRFNLGSNVVSARSIRLMLVTVSILHVANVT